MRGKRPGQTTDQGRRTRDSILVYIQLYCQEHGYAPSLREIADGCGISSTSVVNYNLLKLQREGLLVRGQRGVSRSWHLPPS